LNIQKEKQKLELRGKKEGDGKKKRRTFTLNTSFKGATLKVVEEPPRRERKNNC